MYDVSAQGVYERTINVHYYYYSYSLSLFTPRVVSEEVLAGTGIIGS